MRGSLYAISEIVVFVVGASLLGLLLGLLIRRPRPQTVRAAATAGPERVEIERRLAAAQGRSEALEAKLNSALEDVDSLSRENAKLEELRLAESSGTSSAEIEALQERAAVVDRLEIELAQRDSTLADRERELDEAARQIAALEEAAAATGLDATESPPEATPVAPGVPAAEPEEYLPPRQNPTGPGALTDVVEFEVGGAD
jgi:hypothetical protein